MKKNLFLLFFVMAFAFILKAESTFSYSYDFESGFIGDWSTGQSDYVEITDEDVHSGSYAVKLTTPTTGQNAWDLQFISPEVGVTPGREIKISFWAKAVGGDGVIRISTPVATYLVDQNASNQRYLQDKSITDEWAKYTYTTNWGQTLMTGEEILKFCFDMGTVAGKVYYLDDITIEDMTLDYGERVKFGFESGDLDGFNFSQSGSGSITTEFSNTGSYSAKITTGTVSSNWDYQLQTPSIPVIQHNKYRISFWARLADGQSGGIIGVVPNENHIVKYNSESSLYDDCQYNFPLLEDLTDEWVQYSVDNIWGYSILAGEDELKLNLWLRTSDLTYYIDGIIIEDLTVLGEVDADFITDFEFGTFGGWTSGTGQGTAAITTDDARDEYALKLVTNSSATNAWDLGMITPVINVKQGEKYKISFWAKAVGGTGRLGITAGAGGQLEDGNSSDIRWNVGGFDITADTWAEYSTGEDIIIATTNQINLNFQVGSIAGMTYYLDDIKIEKVIAGGDATGLISSDKEEINLYLSSNTLYLGKLVEKISIYNISGAFCFSIQNTSSVDLSSLTPGVYLTKVEVDGKDYVNKILK